MLNSNPTPASTPSRYSKPFLSLEAQLKLIKGRGLHVLDDAFAIECLHRNGYYRLSGYWYNFRSKDSNNELSDNFQAASSFEDAVELYKFDKRLKLSLLDALERIEVAARVEIARTLGSRDIYAHENALILDAPFTQGGNKSKHAAWLKKYNKHVASSKETFVKHFKSVYGPGVSLPIWVAIELWDFGLLSHFYSGLQYKDRVAVAKRFNVPDWQIMQSWLRSLNYVRNVIAHHGRLWNRNLVETPKMPKKGEIAEFDPLLSTQKITTRVYSICCILSYLTRVTNPTSSWSEDLKAIVQSFPPMPYAQIRSMGFPSDWESHDFWTKGSMINGR